MTDVRRPSQQAAGPTSLGRYELLGELGRGGMGVVYKAVQTHLGKLVALKVLDPAIAARPNSLARFLREARAAAQIRHPHVVEVFDAGIDDGVPFIAMELLEGEDLATCFQRRRSLPLPELIDILAPVVAAVRAAHDVGVIHRDLKPANVFLARRGRTLLTPLVLDFGISKMATDDDEGILTRSEAMLGTAFYIAPEQAKSAHSADQHSDQYSLAVMLYEGATGVRPFQGKSVFEVLQAIATADVRPPSELQPSLPKAFDACVLRAMSRNPADRFPSLEAFGSALLSFASPKCLAVWGRELTGAPAPAVALSEATAPELTLDMPSTAQPTLAGSPGGRRWVRNVASFGAAFLAGALVTWSIRAPAPTNSKPEVRCPSAEPSVGHPTASASMAVATPAPSVSTEERSKSGTPETNTQAAGRAETPIASATSRPSTPNPMGAVPAARRSPAVVRLTVPSTPSADERGAASAAPSSRDVPRRIEIGVNGAPIVE